ncbi:MAG TPA: sensor histidine kinase, partial [Prosthecobacter sp.]
LKFTPSGGRVTVKAARAVGGITIDVSDTGEGIPHDELERIWERLYRVEKSRTQRGLGLGLSFVKAIVEAHQGKMSVESHIGKGARFRVFLPD